MFVLFRALYFWVLRFSFFPLQKIDIGSEWRIDGHITSTSDQLVIRAAVKLETRVLDNWEFVEI